jgi:hypothetical protein
MSNYIEIVEVTHAQWSSADNISIIVSMNVIHHLGDTTEYEEGMTFTYAADDPYSGAFGVEVGNWLASNPDKIEAYVPPPPQPYNFQITNLWDRLTEDEAEEFDGEATTASPLKLRKQFATATSMMSDSELFAWVRNILTGLFGETRADELLAQAI